MTRKNYRISTTEVVYKNGTVKVWYSIQERHHWFFWRPLKIWNECLNRFREDLKEIFLTTDRHLVESILKDVSKAEKKIYGVPVFPKIVRYRKEVLETYNDQGKVCGYTVGFRNGKEYEVLYTCRSLMDSVDGLGLQELKNWDDLVQYIGDLPK